MIAQRVLTQGGGTGGLIAATALAQRGVGVDVVQHRLAASGKMKIAGWAYTDQVPALADRDAADEEHAGALRAFTAAKIGSVTVSPASLASDQVFGGDNLQHGVPQAVGSLLSPAAHGERRQDEAH